MNNILITVTQVVILIIEIGVGYFLAKKDKIPASSLKVLTFLCLNVALPCSVIQAATSLDSSPAVWKSISTGFLIILIVTIVQVIVSLFFFKKAEQKQRPVFQIATVYGNSAFMGIPLVAAVIGSEAVIYATLMVIVDTVFLFTHASLVTGEKPTVRFIFSKVFGIVTISFLIGIVISLIGIKIPLVIDTSMTNFKGMLTPLAMIIVGVQLAQQDYTSIFKQKDSYAVAVLKLIIWPAVIIICLLPIKAYMDSMIIYAIIICKATPQAAVLGVLAEGNGLDGKAAARVVGLTTLLSAITLPIIAGICRMLF